MTLEDDYKDKKVLVLGGLGFIGSNLVLGLLSKGATDVTLLCRDDSRTFTLGEARNKVKIVKADFRDTERVLETSRGMNVIFDLVDNRGHDLIPSESSFDDPLVKARGKFLEGYAEKGGNCRIVYISSRMVYGLANPDQLPLTESCELKPINVSGRIKSESERLVRTSGLDYTILRASVVYGSRALVREVSNGLVGWFIRRAIQDEEVTIHSPGSRLRDFIYVGDLINLMILSGMSKFAGGKIYNAGSGKPITLREMAQGVVDAAGSGRIVDAPNPSSVSEKDSFYLDITKAERELGWVPAIGLEEGLRRTAEFYRTKLPKYI